MKIKKDYKKNTDKLEYNNYLGYYICNEYNIGRYEHKYCWDRYIRTQNERRQNCWAQDDGIHVRGSRRYKHLPTVYEDIMLSRNWGKSWKDFTKCRKQYMVNIK
jgi:hypothetical protein